MDAVHGTRQDPGEDFFFIVGSGRSGTTLLQALLSSHPRLKVPPETHFIKRATNSGAARRAEPDDFDAFWNGIVGWSRFLDLGIDPDAVRALIERDGDRSFRNIFAAILKTYGTANGAERVGEKTPSHCQHVPRLLAWYPEARILFIRRDPRAVVASQLPTPWITEQLRPASPLASFSRRMRLSHVAERARLWQLANGHFLSGCIRDPRVHLVDYETLVTAPDETLRAVCAFLDEDFHPEMLAGREAPTPTASGDGQDAFQEWRRSHRAAARRPVTSAGLHKWRESLSPLEIAMIESLCEDGMRTGGYVPESGGASRRKGAVAAALCLAGLKVEDRIRGIGEQY